MEDLSLPSYIGENMKKRIALLIFLLVLLPANIFAAKESRVVINGQTYQSSHNKYPLMEQNHILYFPLTRDNLKVMGLQYEYRKGQLEFTKTHKFQGESLSYYPSDTIKESPKSFDYLSTLCGFSMDPKYPLLKYKDILYFPLTWRNCVDILHWDYRYEKGCLYLDTDKENFAFPPSNFSVAGRNVVYHLDGTSLYEEKDNHKRELLYHLPETAAHIEMNIVNGILHLKYNMGQSEQSQQRQVIFNPQPREIYSGKYQYFSKNGQEYLVRREILRSNLSILQKEGEEDFTHSNYVFQTKVNGVNNFTQEYGTLRGEQQFLASTDGITFDHIVSVTDEGKVKVLLKDPFLRGFTVYGNHLIVWNDYGIYTYEPGRKERKVLAHVDALRVFPSDNPIYLHQNGSLYQGGENINPLGIIDHITETIDEGQIYTIFQFRGDGKYQTMVLCKGKFVLKSDISLENPTIVGGVLQYYSKTSRSMKYISLEK